MFNQSRPPFGAGFGTTPSAATPFGQSAFNKPATGFGTSFGQQANTSIFGASNTTQTGLFNAPGTSSAFGAPTQQQQPAFGTPFGAAQPQQQQQSMLFGGAQPAQNTSLFGTSTTSAFGAKPAAFGGAFAQTAAPSTGLFGQSAAPQPSGSGFFTQTQQPSMFGATTAVQPGFGTAPNTANAGTSIAKYQPSTDSDTIVVRGSQNNVNTKQHCITFMKEYANNSLEELRFEDYLTNRKGPQAGTSGLFGATTAPGGMFGATSTASGGLFGQTQTSNASTGLFGQTNTLGQNTFGQTTGFGQTTQANNPFGAKPFGTATTSAAPSGFGGFGVGASNTTFGQKPAFGTSTASTGIFGQPANTGFGAQPAQQTGFGFGQQQQQQQPQQAQTSSLFGQTQPSTGFGATNTTFSGFGATSTANTGGGIFGNQAKPATGFGGFGTTPQVSTGFGGTTAFGAQPASGGMFSGSLAKPATTGFGGFGQTNPQAAPTLGSTFGNTFNSGFGTQNAAKPSLFSQPAGGLFGTTGTSFGGGTMLGGGTGGAFGTSNTGFGINASGMQPAQQPSTNIHQQIMNLVAFPYGDNPIYKDLKASVSEDALKPTSTAAQVAALESATKFKVSSQTKENTVKVKPISGVVKRSLFDGLEEYDASLEQCFTLKANPKRLILKTKPLSKPLQESNLDTSSSKPNESFTNQIPTQPPPAPAAEVERRVSWLQSSAFDKVREANQGRVSDVGPIETTMRDFVKPNVVANLSGELESTSIRSDESSLRVSDDDAQPHPAGIVLTRAGYYTIPSKEELATMVDEQGRCVVQNLVVGRTGYGNVFFEDSIDITGFNFDENVHFRHREVIIYPDDENKPPVGEGLNRRAQITLDKIWPHDKTVHEPIKDPERLAAMEYEEKLRKVCDKADTRFLEYRPATGSWVFKVDHFSKYGLVDSDDDDDPAPTDAKKVKPNEPPLVLMPVPLATPKVNLQPPAPPQPQVANKTWPYPPETDFTQTANGIGGTQFNLSQANAILQRMEVDSHKLQAMKSSFFAAVDDEYDNQSIVSDTSEGSSLADQIVPKWGVHQKQQRFISPMILSSISEGERHDDDEIVSLGSGKSTATTNKVPAIAVLMDVETTKIPPLLVRPKIFTDTDINTVIPLKLSVAYPANPKINSVFFNGRKFRVGWGPYSTMQLINGSALDDDGRRRDISNYCSGRMDEDYSANVVKSIQFPSNNRISNFRVTIEAHLEIELKHDKISRDPNVECPFFESNGSTKALVEHVEVAQQLSHLGPDEEYAASVWTLCQSLWGERDELEGVDELSHRAVMFRREMFSEWIEDVITDNEIVKVARRHDYLDQLLELLFGHKVSDACELAMKNDDYNLSLVLAQLSSGQTVKQLLKHQLYLWQDVQADKFIDVRRLKAFMAAAGMAVFESNQGVLNIYDDMDWIKALAFHLWYTCSPTSSITDVVLSYEKTLETSDNTNIRPVPPHKTTPAVAQGESSLKDLRHHILHLYSRRTHSMEQLLNPATHTANPLDLRLSYLLLQFLESLGYTHCSELERSRIFTSFADQLENYGLWQWSIYVLLHIRERSRREATIKGVLLRHIEIHYEPQYIELENFIVDKLGIPETWIYYARAVRAGAMKQYNDQAKFLLHAKEWNLAHETIINHIAPDAILNDKIPFLKMLLKEFKEPKKVSNWTLQGKVLLDFIEVNEVVENFKFLPHDEIATALEDLKDKFAGICSVIKHFPCPTPKHRLCQSEIAQRIASLIRSFHATNRDFATQCSLLKNSLEKLPLPPEYARSEMKHLLTAFLNEELKAE